MEDIREQAHRLFTALAIVYLDKGRKRYIVRRYSFRAMEPQSLPPLIYQLQFAAFVNPAASASDSFVKNILFSFFI